MDDSANYYSKSRSNTSVARKSSCSSGWLRLIAQSSFAVITLTSFILIVIMAIKNPLPSPAMRPTAPLRCHVQGCRVHCKEAPYFEKYEKDIALAVMDADSQCKRVYLELVQPYFTNSTLPHTWLPRLRNNIRELSIYGGNLMHIPSGAFMAQFTGTLRSLVFRDITIRTFESTSLVGLSSLRSFNIINCWIDDVQENALRAVDDTLEILTINESGHWDPINFSGFIGLERLSIVDFSYNNFNNILNRQSFVGLKVTKILYLNFCKITSIGPGTFDHLENIEVLFLNNNMLTTIPPGLFAPIVALDNPRPRINLQDNYWYCDCSVDDFMQLVRKEVLLVEAKCLDPDEFSCSTFTQFEHVCNNKTDSPKENYTSDIIAYNSRMYYETISVNGSYCGSSRSSNSYKLISPITNNKCSSRTMKHANISELTNYHRENSGDNGSDWLKFSYYIQTDLFSIIQIKATKEHNDYGLVWYQTTCSHEIYCLDVIPSGLKLYDADPSSHYVFCPMNMKNGTIENEDCIAVAVQKYKVHQGIFSLRLIVYLTSMFLCSCLGAIVVYGLIIKKPTLLKGSKRIVFVKHKNVDALVLPPKVPLRNDFIDFKDKEVFTLTSANNDRLKLPNMKRMKSVRSDKSGSPSYISAMQPTDDQLAEWRIRHHFNNDLTISSRKSELSMLSWIDTYYYSLDESDRTYESLK